MTGCPGWCVYQGEHAREHYSHQGPITTAESCHVMLSASSGATEIVLRHLDLESMVYVPLADAARTSTLLAHLGHHSLAAAIKSAADLAGADATADLDDMGDDITDALAPDVAQPADLPEPAWPHTGCTIGERPDVIRNPFGMIEILPEVTL